MKWSRDIEHQFISANALVAAFALNKGGEIEDEGFVVVDEKHNRIKIKSPAYL